MQQDQLLTVSDYIKSLNEVLGELPANVIGEVITVKMHANGHAYFTLKDKEDGAVLECVMWAYQYRINGIQLFVGMEVVVQGSANIYAPWGKLSFIAKTINLVGEGALKKAYDELKLRLSKEGLFFPYRKRPLPSLPQKIGVITSKHGAVIHDFENNLGKHGFSIRFVDSRVEGKEAIYDLLSSIERLANEDLDILVIMRGGGSLQSLAAFDSEALVRSVAQFPIPVIAAIGHHMDVPLVALAADLTVSTPTAAAMEVSRSWEQAVNTFSKDSQLIINSLSQQLNDANLSLQMHKQFITDKFSNFFHVFQKASHKIAVASAKIEGQLPSMKFNINNKSKEIVFAYQQLLTQSHKRIKDTSNSLDRLWPSIFDSYNELNITWSEHIYRSYTYVIRHTKDELIHSDKIIQMRNPLRLLQKGYSIVRHGGTLVKEVKDVTIGEQIEVILSDGKILSQIKNITQNNKTETYE